jgi:hypothetical protein
MNTGKKVGCSVPSAICIENHMGACILNASAATANQTTPTQPDMLIRIRNVCNLVYFGSASSWNTNIDDEQERRYLGWTRVFM